MNELDLPAAMEQLQQNLSEAEQVEVTERILGRLPKEALIQPEPNLLQRVTAVFRRHQARSANRPVQPATLQFDSWTQPAALGVRGGRPGERQLLFNQGQYDLDLQMVKEAQNNTITLRGQLLPAELLQSEEPLEGIELRLVDTAGEQSQGLTDELGRFSFSYCVAGRYDLWVILDDRVILLESLIVEA